MNVVWHYSAGPSLARRLAALDGDELTVTVCPPTDRACFQTLLESVEVIWHLLEPVTASVIAAAPKLRLVQKIGVGVNTIDLEAARARGIAVCNMPETNSQAVAEMTLLLMLATLRRLHHLHAATAQGRGWVDTTRWQEGMGEVSGRTVGLVGYGAVPQRLAPMLTAMGARVLYTSLTAKASAVGEPRSLHALLAESDIVSLHVPLTAETTHLIDAAAIARMKPGAILINTARGALVDEGALVKALENGALTGVGLDVFETEPPRSDDPLLSLETVVATPHVAWLTQETLDRSLTVAIENCRRLQRGEKLLHQVV